MSASTSKLPHIAALACIVLGLLLGILGSTLTGGIIAGVAVIPACWGMWAGMQQDSQGSLVLALLLFVVSVGVTSLLIVARVLGWLAG
ncbi:hypothetical protein [Haliangium sp.]|uniref:hypothetical protein n=1 Tax=Haliangium sp. TaxID=2663208 RepID=UPI003D114039